MSKFFLIFSFYFITTFASPNDTCIIFTEVMFYAVSGNNEFVELYNRSETKTIDLRNFSIKYYTSKSDTIISAGYGTLLPPKSYAVIFEGDYDFSSGLYKNIVPPSAVKMKISDNAFGSNGMSNTSNRPIWLINAANDTIDRYTYSANNKLGYSDEKIYMNKDTNAVNWRNSVKYLGTPGYKNSVVPSGNDLMIAAFSSTPNVISGENAGLNIKIINAGTNNSSGYTLNIYNDIDKDSITESGERIISQTENGIFSADSISITLSTTNYLQGRNYFIAELSYPPDEDVTNNIAFTNFNVGTSGNKVNDIIVNEIMYAPHSPEPEWFELYNRTTTPINFKNWTITDIYTTPSTVKINTDITLQGKSFLIIARDSAIYNSHRYIPSPLLFMSIPALNNDADGIVIKDGNGIIIDSVQYDQSWGGNDGYSLERISPDAGSLVKQNWGTSRDIEKSTPGRTNSLTEKEYDLSVAGIFTDPRFPVAGNNITISATIKNNGTSNANNFIVEFYYKYANEDWELKYTTNNMNLISGDSISILSDQKIINLQSKYSISVHVLYPADQDTLNNYFELSVEPGAVAGSVIINEIMYDPDKDEPEWVELKNISPDIINLKDWSISDILTYPTKDVITDQDLFLSPGSLFIAARDSSFYFIHPELSSQIKVVLFGSLGNTTDGIMVYDYRDGVIDSIMYKSSWGHRKGYSIERISDKKSSTDSSNWVISLSREKSTPGKENSVVNIPDGNRNDLVINEIMFDPAIGNNEFIEFINLKKDSANIGGWRIEDQHANKYVLSDSNFVIGPGTYFLLVADSSVLKGYNLYDYRNKSVLNVSDLGLTAEEMILLKDLRGNVIDSVYYSDKWHNKNFINTKGRSLERINPYLESNDQYNWNTCVDPKGATPGAKNSIYTKNESPASGISVKPNPFSPDNDGFEDCTIISYSLQIPVSQVNIKIFDSHGRLVRVLSNNMASGKTGSIIFDGLGDDRMPLRIGIYIIFLEALNSITGANEILKTIVVVARKLH